MLCDNYAPFQGSLRLPSGYPEATLRLPGRSGAGGGGPGAGGQPSSGNSTNQSAKARAITTNSNNNPVHEIARHVTAKEQGRGAAWPLMLQVGNLCPGPDGGGRGRRR